jgi:hypothetical protein
MTTLNPATRLSSPDLAVTRAGPPLRVRLPAGGWQVGFRAQHDGRTVIEVTGQDGSLAGLVASSRLPILSVDAGWCGAASERDGGRRWWALAIGHVPAGQGQPSVTFTRRLETELAVDSPSTQKIMSQKVREDVSSAGCGCRLAGPFGAGTRSRREPAASARAGA